VEPDSTDLDPLKLQASTDAGGAATAMQQRSSRL
jgi:hypothetical protein